MSKKQKDNTPQPTKEEAEGVKQLIAMIMQMQEGMKKNAPEMHRQMMEEGQQKKPS